MSMTDNNDDDGVARAMEKLVLWTYGPVRLHAGS